MSKIYGYRLYNVNSSRDEQHWFVYNAKCYATLSGAKNSKIIEHHSSIQVPNSTWIIVPVYYLYSNHDPIKYMLIDGEWTTDIDEKIARAFYNWRER